MKVFAIASHPDDIEFRMAGTMFLLKKAGCELHYMNIANGDCGTAKYGKKEIAGIRKKEAVEAAEFMGAVFHESIVSDLEVFYNKENLAKIISVVREVTPDIVLTHYPFEYMEDHMNACRLAVSATFSRGMLNAPCHPPLEPVDGDVTVYHAMPHGLCGPMREAVIPEMYCDVSTVMKEKKRMLARHSSQKEWLDASQGMDSYIIELENQDRKCGKMSGVFEFAEGWSRRLHLGFCAEDADPLGKILGTKISKTR
jgi:LmbE family N-acetylglucosaminyl deacetylase